VLESVGQQADSGGYRPSACVGTLFVSTTFTGANLSGASMGTQGELSGNIVSGGITGTPSALPPNWILQSGYLFSQ